MMHNLDVESPGMLHLPSFSFILSLVNRRPLHTLLWLELQKCLSLVLNFPCLCHRMLLRFNLLLLIVNFVFSSAVNSVPQDGISFQCCFCCLLYLSLPFI